jgi:hypothetical protein
MSNEQQKTAEQIRAEILKRREDAEAVLEAAIAQKRAEDFAAAADFLTDPANGYYEPEVTKATLPTLVVFRRPTKAEASRYRSVSNKESVDARIGARIDLATQIVLWPDAKAYADLVADCAFVPDKIAVMAIRLAEGEAKRELKT